MRYHASPRFETRHWSMLWHNNIPDLETLHWRASQGGLVIISIGKTKHVNEDPTAPFVDLCFINPIQESQKQPLRDLEGFTQQYNARTHIIRPEKYRPVGDKTKIFLRPAAVTSHVSYNVESSLCELMELFKSQLPKPDGLLTLVVYDHFLELDCLSMLCPKFLQFFNNWVDLGELSREISPNQQKVSLEKTLEGFGYPIRQDKKQRLPDAQWPPIVPLAGSNEAFRGAVALVNMFWHPRGSVVGNIPLWDRKALEQTIEKQVSPMAYSWDQPARPEECDLLDIPIPSVPKLPIPNWVQDAGGRSPDRTLFVTSGTKGPLVLLPPRPTRLAKRQIIKDWAAAITGPQPDNA